MDSEALEYRLLIPIGNQELILELEEEYVEETAEQKEQKDVKIQEMEDVLYVKELNYMVSNCHSECDNSDLSLSYSSKILHSVHLNNFQLLTVEYIEQK